MQIQDIIKVLPENEPIVFQYGNNSLLFKIVKKHYQVSSCLVAINNDRPEYMKKTAFNLRKRDEIGKLVVSNDPIPYIIAEIKQ